MGDSSCPCCSNRDDSDCCGPVLAGTRGVKDPESLMRSRYTAFCRGDADYLVATLDPDKRSDPGDLGRLKQDLDRTMASTQWLGLKILSSEMESGGVGYVEFAAFFTRKGMGGSAVEQLHERSCFVLRDGSWFYREGQILKDIAMGRNTPCFCGSGKKYKHCHGSNA